MDFDYQYWADLAKKDPQRFEHERKQVIEDVITSASPRNQSTLRQLQWKVDSIRLTSKTPLQATLRISAMMHERFLLLNEVLCQATGQSPAVEPLPKRAKLAKIIPIGKRTN